MMTSYYQEDAGGRLPDEVRDQFITPMNDSADAALTPARALLDSSRARDIAINLRQAFHGHGELFEAVLAKRRQLQASTSTKTELRRAAWLEYGTEAGDEITHLQNTIITGSDELAVALSEEALPVSADPAAVIIAREEISLAMRVDATDTKPALMVLIEQASRGGDISAVCASEFGRLLLRQAQGGKDEGWPLILDAAVQAALNGPDEGKKRAAAALAATRKPLTSKVGALADAAAYAVYVRIVITNTLAGGIVLA